MITWTDVRATIPQPRAADDATSGNRSAQVRLWSTPTAPYPYSVTVTLRVDGSEVETWANGYRGDAALNRAVHAYSDVRGRAERWLLGSPLELQRPRSDLWKIERRAP